MPSRRGDGTLVFKICFYGPSLGGKTTALEWVYNRVNHINSMGFYKGTRFGRYATDTGSNRSNIIL